MPKAATKIELWPTAQLKPYEKNAKNHPSKQVHALAKIINDHGFDQAIVVDKNGIIIKGHGRLEAAKHLGLKKVPVIVRDDLTPAQVRAARIADNTIAELGKWDAELLALDVREALELFPEFDTEILGLKTSFVNSHLRITGEVEEVETPEPPEVAITQPGDVWRLGQHLLTCGDARAYKLPKPPHVVFTDPPYGMNYQSNHGTTKTPNKFAKIANDALTGEALVEFIRAAVPAAEYRFVCCNFHGYAAFERALGKPKCVIVWDKGSIGLGAGYRPQHEWVMFHGMMPDRTDLSDVWQINRAHRADYQHPTQKPVALAAKALLDVEARDVYDPFGGSGSTLLAAEQLGIACTMVELEPKYCDVIVQRWEMLTGLKAERASKLAA